MNYLDFEQPIDELREKIASLRLMKEAPGLNLAEEIHRLEQKCVTMTQTIFKNLTPWQITQLARHPLRPHSIDILQHVFTDFEPLHGDRLFRDDQALIGGLARLNERPVVVVAQEKGRETQEKVKHQFGMPQPEGYRKALRLFQLANRFELPIITIIDTPGAYPGIEAEARGQSEAIARNLFEMAALSVPVLSLVLGEGCSGGALGIGVSDRTLMMQYSYYATISPEGCASILWKSAERAQEAASAMQLTAEALHQAGLIDAIVPEPLGGAHRDPKATYQNIQQHLNEHLIALLQLEPQTRQAQRWERLRCLGGDHRG